MDVRFAYQANCWGPLGGNAVGVTSIGQLTYRHLRRHGPRIADIGGAGYQGVELFDGNILDYPGGAKALDLGAFGRGRQAWSPPIPAPISSSPTSSIRSSAASPASPTPRLSSRRSIWWSAAGPSGSKAWRAATTSV